MAKQTFTTGQVLTAAQMTSLQQTAMLGGEAAVKTASYTLVAADAGTSVAMNSTSATTVTVNTGLFAAGDTVNIVNQNTGVCTITAGTATVNKASGASLALSQYQGGVLDFVSASSAIFFPFDVGSSGGGKVLQVVSTTSTTGTTINSTSFTDITNMSLSITPSSATSKVLVLIMQPAAAYVSTAGDTAGNSMQLLRDATVINIVQTSHFGTASGMYLYAGGPGANLGAVYGVSFLDSPATTSSTTYKIQGRALSTANSGGSSFGGSSTGGASFILMEIGA